MVLPEITAQIKEGAVVKGTIAGGILLGVGAVKGISKGAKFFGEEIKIVEPKRALQKDKLIKRRNTNDDKRRYKGNRKGA